MTETKLVRAILMALFVMAAVFGLTACGTEATPGKLPVSNQVEGLRIAWRGFSPEQQYYLCLDYNSNRRDRMLDQFHRGSGYMFDGPVVDEFFNSRCDP